MGWFGKSREQKFKEVIEQNKQNYKEYFDFEKFPNPGKTFNIKLVGVTFDNEDDTSRQLIIEDANIGEHLMLLQELDNKYDDYAVLVSRFNGLSIGYLPSSHNMDIWEMLEKQCFVDAELIDKPYYEGIYGAVLKLTKYY